MAHLSTSEAQTWLEATKLSISEVDAELEESLVSQVFSAVAVSYDTSAWLAIGTTPVLIRKVIAMLYAAAVYRRAYSEEDPDGGGLAGYATWLENRAMAILMGIITGTLDLLDVEGSISNVSGPDFWPNDSTEVTEPESARKFSMGAKF